MAYNTCKNYIHVNDFVLIYTLNGTKTYIYVTTYVIIKYLGNSLGCYIIDVVIISSLLQQ